MLKAGYISESEKRPAPSVDDERRRYDRLFQFGKRVLQAEVTRLNRSVARARLKKIFSQG